MAMSQTLHGLDGNRFSLQAEHRSFVELEDDTAEVVSDVMQSTTRQGLNAFKSPDVQLVIWQRTLPDALSAWLEQLDESLLPILRVLLQPSELRSAMESLLHECGMPEGDMLNLLIDDIDGLVSAFADVTDSERVDVRLESVNHDACWKFHRDSVEARLLMTYRGPATEWVQPEHAERAVLDQKQFDGPIEHLGLHDVAIFKGSDAGPNCGVVHRSPPIAGTGCTRLLLCITKRITHAPEPQVET